MLNKRKNKTRLTFHKMLSCDKKSGPTTLQHQHNIPCFKTKNKEGREQQQKKILILLEFVLLQRKLLPLK